MKLDLLTNATVVEDAIRFVTSSESQKPKEQPRLSSGNNNEGDNESKTEPDYNEETKSDKTSEEKQEEESGEIALTTTANQVF